MNRLLILIISLFFLNNCSLNENSRIWNDKEEKIIDPKNIKKVFSEKKVVTQFNQELKLENPISSELGIMRNSLFPNLLDIASRNFSRGIESTEIFEVGFTYDGVEPSNQNSSFALLLSGSTSKKTWHNPRRNYDFFDMKSIINALFEELLIVGIEYKRSNIFPTLTTYTK